MRLDIYHHFVQGNDVPPWAKAMLDKLGIILNKQETLLTIAQDLETEVAEQSTVISGVETVVQNLIDAVEAAGTDKELLAAVLTNAKANKARLGALVAAGTPANTEAVASPAAPEITS